MKFVLAVVIINLCSIFTVFASDLYSLELKNVPKSEDIFDTDFTDVVIGDEQTYSCHAGQVLDLSSKHIRINEGGVLTIKNCRIIYRVPSKSKVKELIVVDGGGISLVDNEILLSISDDVLVGRNNLSTSGPSHWLVRSTGKSEIVFERNDISVAQWYGVGLLFSRKNDQVVYRVVDNCFEHLHGVLYLGNATGQIVGNKFMRNSFGNIVAGKGDDLNIANNQIFFPGNGTSGDGMTLSNIANSTITDNKIVGGSCYGIWMSGVNENVSIVENLITDDITSALYFSEKGRFDNFEVLSNTLINNGGSAIALLGSVDRFVVRGNIFHGNSRGGDQLLISRKLKKGSYSFIDNLEFLEIDRSIVGDGYSHVRDYHLDR